MIESNDISGEKIRMKETVEGEWPLGRAVCGALGKRWWVLPPSSFDFVLRHLVFGDSCLGFPGGTSGKESTIQCRRRKRHGFNPWGRKIPWRKAWQPIPVLLPGESHGQRSLAGYRRWGRNESDITE